MKRSYGTFFVTAVMILGLVFLLVTRGYTDHAAPAFVPPPAPAPPSATASASAPPSASAAPPAAPSGSAAPPAPAPAPALRVVGVGRDVAVLAAAVLGAREPRVDVVRDDDEVSYVGRLTRGGSDATGADVLVLPLVDFVEAHEGMRALAPEVFAVGAFARGGGALRGEAGSLVRPLPATGEVRVIGVPRADGSGLRFDAASLTLALFALETAGVAPTRVRAVAADTRDAATAKFSTSLDTGAAGAKVLLSVADASRLLPVVLVARKATLDARAAELGSLVARWREGAARVVAEPSSGLRSVGALDLGPGISPESALVGALARLDPEPVSLAPEGPTSLPALVAETFHLLHAGGVVAGAPPEPAPVHALPLPPAPAPGPAPAPAPASSPAVLTHRSKDEAEAVARAELLAFVFPRATLRIGAPAGEKGALAVTSALEARGVAAARLVASKAASASGETVVEVIVPR